MKRIAVSIGVWGLLFSLCACDIHFGSARYDLPWWVIAIPVAVFCAFAFVAGGIWLSRKKYICPKCGKSFHPKWYAAMFSVHINDDRLFKCPHCGKRGFCHLSHDQSDDK